MPKYGAFLYGATGADYTAPLARIWINGTERTLDDNDLRIPILIDISNDG